MAENTYSISEIRDAITHLPEKFEQEQEPEAVKVTRRGKPVLAILPWDLYESIMETLDVMSDPELMAAFRAGLKDIEECRIILLDDALKELGWE